MADFLEERISGEISYGSSYEDDYAVQITQTASGAEYRKLVHGYPTRRFKLIFRLKLADTPAKVANLYHRVFGRYAGFRVKALDDFTTAADGRSAQSSIDQTLALVSAGVYQLQKVYGLDAAGLGIGRPARKIYKPVAGTVQVAVSAVTINAALLTIDTTTGQVTFAANISGTITAITKAAQAVITIGAHSLTTNHSVYISGVSGMTEINGQRANIVATGATTITVAINSSGYSTYTSGGTVNTRPQGAEPVTGGCEFDIPVRFDTALAIDQTQPAHRQLDSVELVELLSP